jgi:hypothetical protein
MVVGVRASPGIPRTLCETLAPPYPSSRSGLSSLKKLLWLPSVELGYHERVARSHRGECLIEAWPCAGGSGQPVVEVDPFGGDAELSQALALGGEVLFVAGTAGVANDRLAHGRGAYG